MQKEEIVVMSTNEKYITVLKRVALHNGIKITVTCNPVELIYYLMKDSSQEKVMIDVCNTNFNIKELMSILEKIVKKVKILLLINNDSDSELKMFEIGYLNYTFIDGNPLTQIMKLEKMSPLYSNGRINDFDFSARDGIIKVLGDSIQLTGIETLIVDLLQKNEGRVITREQIVDEISANNKDNELYKLRTVDVHIRNVRKKIGRNQIITINGKGYMWRNIE